MQENEKLGIHNSTLRTTKNMFTLDYVATNSKVAHIFHIVQPMQVNVHKTQNDHFERSFHRIIF